MNTVNKNELKYYILKMDYFMLSKMMYNVQDKINNFEKFLIYSKENNIKCLSKIINNLSIVYNKELTILNIDKNINIDRISKMYQLIINKRNMRRKEEEEMKEFVDYDPLNEIKDQLRTICKEVGFTNINDLIHIVLNVNDIFFLEDVKIKHNLLNEIFIPIYYDIKNIDISCINNILSIKKSNDQKNMIFFNNICKVEYIINRVKIVLTGFIKKDILNINMSISQLNYPFIYEKKHIFENIMNIYKNNDKINKINKINIDFFNKYLLNLSTIDYLALDEDDFVDELLEYYDKYLDYSSMTFLKLLKLFTKEAIDNLNIMYKIIKILLCGNNNDCSMASLLFNLLKDKRTINNSDFVTNIIYEQLSYSSQIRLSNSVFDPKKEIDKIKTISSNDLDLKNQLLLSTDMPDYVKKICFDKLEELKTSNNETYKIKMYINILIKYPWISQNDDNVFKFLLDDKLKIKNFLTNIKNKMDENIYGHKNTKTKIIQMMGKLISVQGSNINPIALVGPPGIGKTKFAKILSECLNIPFVQITLGGQNDGELLHGHGYTYSGSQPGLIVKKMCDAGSARCIMYFDELDKCVSKNGQSNELMSILIHLTDSMTNSMFQDRFFQEITFPLNKVIFIFSFNDISKVDKILLDRLETIEINNYSLNDKILISNNYLLKQCFKETGFEEKSIIFPNDILTKIIKDYTDESGVRELKRKLDTVMSTLNSDKLFQINMFENDKIYTTDDPLIITEDMLYDIFGKTKIYLKMVSKEDKIGYGNGLFVSGDSGGVLDIQIEKNNFKNDKFELKITGNLKTVMHESVHYSFNVALSLITNDAKILFYNRYPDGLFIHFPSASEKDGPSAGGLICICFLSIILDLKIKNSYAMTGEIDLNYNIGAIGGVRNKILGGFKHGVNTVILPEENKNDIITLQKDMPEIFDDIHKYIMVKNIYDVIKIIFVDYETKKHFFNKIF